MIEQYVVNTSTRVEFALIDRSRIVALSPLIPVKLNINSILLLLLYIVNLRDLYIMKKPGSEFSNFFLFHLTSCVDFRGYFFSIAIPKIGFR